MTRNQYIVRLFCEGNSVFLLGHMYADLAQPDIENILRNALKRHGRAANPKKGKQK